MLLEFANRILTTWATLTYHLTVYLKREEEVRHRGKEYIPLYGVTILLIPLANPFYQVDR